MDVDLAASAAVFAVFCSELTKGRVSCCWGTLSFGRRPPTHHHCVVVLTDDATPAYPNDHGVISAKRGDHNRLGFALQLTTARFLGTFLEDPLDVPGSVLQTLLRQLRVTNLHQLPRYRSANQRWEHTAKIKSRYGFRDWVDPTVSLRLSRWLFALCWGHCLSFHL